MTVAISKALGSGRDDGRVRVDREHLGVRRRVRGPGRARLRRA